MRETEGKTIGTHGHIQGRDRKDLEGWVLGVMECRVSASKELAHWSTQRKRRREK